LSRSRALVSAGLALGLFVVVGVGCGGGETKEMSTGLAGRTGRAGRGGSSAGGAAGGVPLGGAGGGPAHQEAGQSWTILVYMAADNNLEPFALQDLAEMAAVGSTDAVHVVAQIDRSAGYSAQAIGNLPNFTGTKRLLVRQGSLDVLDTLGQVDSGSGATLADFITWGMTTFPADRTALVLWDHGGGWYGYGQDEAAGSIIRPEALRNAIAQGLGGASSARLALVVFDACLMGTFEIANMLKPYAEYMLASEEVVPGHGLDYRALAGLAADPTLPPPTVARALVDGYVEQSAANRDLASITMSVTDLYALGELEAALQNLSTIGGMPLPAAKATSAGRARAAARSFGNQGQTPGVMVDVVDFAARLAAMDGAYGPSSTAIAAGVQRAVLYETHGPSRAGSHGLSVYFPQQLHDADPTYEQIMDVAAWRAFLYAYLGIANSGPVAAPAFVNGGGTVTPQLVDGSMVVSAALTAGSTAVVNRATLYYGLYDQASDTLYLLGSTPATVQGTTVTGSWDLGILRLDQGLAAAYGYLSVDLTADGGIALTIPFVYRPAPTAAGQTAFRMLVFDAASSLVQDSYFTEVGGVLGELTAETGATLSSTILVSDATDVSWRETDAAFDALTPIVPSLEQVPSGEVVFGELVVENIQEESSFVIAVAAAP
jgi:hypothetical protein